MSESLIHISSVLVADMGKHSMNIFIPIECKTCYGNKTIETKLLLDTGAGGLFMNKSYAQKHHIQLYALKQPIIPKNVDGTSNQAGAITHCTWIRARFGTHNQLLRLFLTQLGDHDIILGLPWFPEYNPQIDWI